MKGIMARVPDLMETPSGLMHVPLEVLRRGIGRQHADLLSEMTMSA